MRLSRMHAAVVTAAVACHGLGDRPIAQTRSGRALVEAAYEQKRVPAMRTEVRMVIVDGERQWQRTATIESRQGKNGNQSQRFTFRTPADLAGSTVLTLEEGAGDPAQWAYIPAYHTARRISASQRGEAYLGTDYSYYDVLDRRWDDYRYTDLGSEVVDGTNTTRVEAAPAADRLQRLIPYSRTIYFVDPVRNVVVREDHFDRQGKLLKRLTNAALVRHSRYLLWDHTTMENLQTGHKTISTITRREVDIPIPDDVFTVRALKRPH
jgi:hypothetical protein